MGLMDKAKFWKKDESDDFGDLSDLGDFGLEDKPAAPAAGHDGLGAMPGSENDAFPPLDDSTSPDLGAIGAHREEVPPTQASLDMGNDLGLQPAPAAHESAPAQPTHAAMPPPARAAPAQPAPQQYAPPAAMPAGVGELTKDVEIIHAKLDAIKASLDSINQRLATLERMANPQTGQQQRYTW